MQPETCPSRKKHRCHQLANRLGMVLIPLFALILSGADSEIQESTAGGPLPPAADKQVRFMVDVRPILQNKCIRCHGGGKNKGKFKIDTRETILEGGVSGPSAVVGDSTNSLLVRLVSGTDPDSVMPPEGTPLTAEQVGILRAWIDQGVQWDEGFILGVFKDAPIAPRKPDLPLPGPSGSTNPIDRFIEASTQGKETTIGQVVSDRVYARRVYLDIIGLLPAPEELDAFLADASTDKRDRLVKDLLSRNQDYAANWMTFWNDALRNDFAGTGYIDGGREQITSWLYRSLESNAPYDEFVSGLIHPTTEARGFIKGIIWRGVVNSSQTPEMQAAQNVAQVFMGINLKCASCHDSLISNWKLGDAYGFASAFAEKPLGIARCDTPTGTTATARFLYPELGEISADAPRDQRLARMAEILTGESNGRLTRTIINRLWARFFGRGLIEPVDEMDNDPWNPDLLDYLAYHLMETGYDLKSTIQLILASKAYQMPAVTLDLLNTKSYLFQGPVVRRMTAEQFRDAFGSIADVWPATSEAGFRIPGLPQDREKIRAWQLMADPLTTALGRPNREQVITSRQTLATTLQALEITNGQRITSLLRIGAGNLLQASAGDPEKIIETLFLKALGRLPLAEEKPVAHEIIGNPAHIEGVEDLLWSVAMLPEFQLIY